MVSVYLVNASNATINKPGNALQCHVALNVIVVKSETRRGLRLFLTYKQNSRLHGLRCFNSQRGHPGAEN